MVAVYYVVWLRQLRVFDFELLRYIFVGRPAAAFYFIVTIIQFYALAPLWKRLLERIHIAWALPAAAFISLLSAQYLPDLLASFGVSGFAWSDRVFTTYLVWWVAGLFIGCDWDNFAASLERSRPVLAALTVVFGLLDARATYDAWVRGVSHAYAEPLHMIYAVCAIMLVLSLGLLVRDESRAGSVLGEIDRAGYGIYLSHLLVLSATQLVLDYVGITRLLWRTAICAVVTYAVSIGANIAYQKLVGYIKAKINPPCRRSKNAVPAGIRSGKQSVKNKFTGGQMR